MYLEYFGLREPPFSITPDPRYVFLSERHRDALAHLLYGIGKGGSGGFVQLTGEVGTGKTTLCRLLLEQLPANTRAALVLNPGLSPVGLLETVCEELKLPIEGRRNSLKGLIDTLNTFLLEAYAQGLRVVLIVDEAQNLNTRTLEQVRLLTNLETSTQKLLQIILLGQPELREILDQPELRQLAQRITARYHLTPLNMAETEAYVRHRMKVAGCSRIPFTRLGLKALYRRSGGVPRLLNIIADRALTAAYARERDVIGEWLVDRAADETLPDAHISFTWTGLKALYRRSGSILRLLNTIAEYALMAADRRERDAIDERLADYDVAEMLHGHARYQMRRYAMAALILLAIAGGIYWAREYRQVPADADAAAVTPAAAVAQPADAEAARLRAHLAGTSQTELTAFTQLLSRWQVDAERVSAHDAARCPASVVPGIACLRGHATLDQLIHFDRPLILRLGTAEHPAYALLQGVGKRKVRLDLDDRRYELARESLSKLWNGDFIVLWRLPSGVSANLKRGDSGAGVDWIANRLATFDGGAVAKDRANNTFDAALEERMRKLQQAYGIKPDGAIGPETLFALSALDDSGPRLSRAVE
ncbi:MAG: AAA family ATPase [Rhodanobacter sp.]|jgi:general secretion pathway protein A|nr:AAA family ATPase [Rhodanobacter sp.]